MPGNFDISVFEELAKAIKLEGSLRDVKAELYKIDDNAKRAELVRDVISMANTARRQGQPARIIFGIKEEFEEIDQDSIAEGSIYEAETVLTVCGITGQYIRQILPQNWNRWNVARQADVIDRELHSILRNYIEPEPEWEYLVGRWREEVVGYLEIRPSLSGPFRVKQEITYEERGKLKRLIPGDTWVREGESKKHLPSHQHHLLYCWRDVPYIALETWRQYTNDCKNEFSLSPLKYPVTLECEYHNEVMSLEDAIGQFLLDAQQRVIYLSGRPGAGKSIFLQDQMHKLSDQLAEYLNGLPPDQPPEYPIPVWLDLNNCRFDNENVFADALVDMLDQFGYLGLRRSDKPANIFGDENLRFVFLLDAWDELDSNGWAESRRSIISFLQKHSNVKAVITSRPSTIEMQRGWTIASIAKVSPDTIAIYLEDLRDPFSLIQLFDKYEELLDIISNPLALKTTLEYAQLKDGEGRELTLSGLVHSIVMELLRHETEKDSSPDRSIKRLQCISSLQELAWWLDGRHEDARWEVALDRLGAGNRTIGRESMQKGMDMELLKSTEEGVTFVATIVKAYFFVRKLLKLAEEQPDDWWDKIKHCRRHRTFWITCQEMARPWADAELELMFANWLARLRIVRQLRHLTRRMQS